MSRAGQYVRQPSGYRAFMPRPFPPDPPIELDGGLQQLLSAADRALGRLDGSIQTLPDPDLFVFMYVRKEAVLSSQIEGTQSSLNDVLSAEAHMMDPDRPRDVAEVLNYVKAMNHGLARLDTLPISVRLLQELHEILLRNVRGGRHQPGELRTSQNWIGPAGATLNEASFVPPPPHEVPQALSDLERFLHSDASLPALIKIGLAHAQFETIHPFLDGNGRIGRLLITFLLCEREILQKPVLYLSWYFRQHRETYYARLQGLRDEPKGWEAWLEFFLAGVAEVSREATQTARRIVELRENHRALITRHFGRVAGNGLMVLERLYTAPIVTVNTVASQLQVSFSAANNLMNKFIEHGLLAEFTGQARNRQFRYDAYVRIFSE